MLSILIPSYNYNVVELVNKVHQQALLALIPFEIIVLDDCSTNQEIKNTNKKNIEIKEHCTFIANDNNLGRTESRNLLASEAKYAMLLFLDSDVMPKYNDFISRFELNDNKDCEVIYGGVCYNNENPKPDQLLRWKYGHKRETKDVASRQKEPYFIISQNLLINKVVFIKNNTSNINIYGLDILFSGNLLKNKIQVKHIDNPVYHLGLENNITFLNKSLEAVKTTFLLEKNKLIESDLRPLQKSYLLLKKWKLVGLFNMVFKTFKKTIKNNLLSKNPSMFLFDLYRLQYYIELKSDKDA